MSKPVNFLPFALFQSSSSSHIILIFLPSPTPNLPPPLSLSPTWAEANSDPSSELSTPMDLDSDCDYSVSCVFFSILTCVLYVK